MYITKSDELHLELLDARYEAKAAIRESMSGEGDYLYANAACNVWDDVLDRWESYNTLGTV